MELCLIGIVLDWVEVSLLFLDHGTHVEVFRTTFLALKCLETDAEVSQSVLWPKCTEPHSLPSGLRGRCAEAYVLEGEETT